MVLPLIAGIALKGLASNAIGGALGGNQQGASNPINSIFGGDDQKQGQKDGIGSLISTLLDPLGILGLGKNDEGEQNQQQMPQMPPFGKKPMMPPPPMPMMNFLG